MTDVSVILCYFSPVGAELPAKHFRTTLQMCVDTGAEVCVAQAYHPDSKPLETPGATHSRSFATAEDLFFKENLWNLAAQDATRPKLLFIDADIYWKTEQWLDLVSAALDDYKIVQPFDTAHWHTRSGGIDPTRTKTSWFYSLSHGMALNCQFCHPGFGYGIRRKTFDAIGGFFEAGVLGSGDHMFCAAVTPAQYITNLFDQARRGENAIGHSHAKAYWKATAKQFLCPSFLEYLTQAQKVIGDINDLGYVCTPVFHRWHGDVENRNYQSRLDYVDWPDKDPPCVSRPDGLLRWSIPQPRVSEWWLARDDDGTRGGKRTLKYKPVI